MGTLPRPDLKAGPHQDLVHDLHALHHRAGWPSLRVLARKAGCSPTTVSTVFSSTRLPSWGVLELLVEAMDGDVHGFHELWLSATTPSEPPGAAGVRIAGRRSELAVVRRQFDTGSGGLLLVAGEAGMGKSRLVSAAAGDAAATTWVASGSCLPLSADVPLLPVADALRGVHDVDDGRWLRDALNACAPYVAGSLGRLLPELDLPLGAPPERDDDWSRYRLFTAVATVLSSLKALRPLALLVDDLHWADTVTLEILEHLLSRGIDVPIVGTWRLDDPTTPIANVEWWARMQRHSSVRTLTLGPLSRKDTAEQLSMVTAGDVAEEQVERIYRRSEGQPLFTEQLALRSDDGRLPRLLGELLDQRIAGLSDPGWAVARALGVADRSLSDALLAVVTGLRSVELMSGLHELAERRLLNPFAGHDVRLAHPLLAEAVRRRLLALEAVDEHRRIAAALADSSAPSPAEVASHWQLAEERNQEFVWRIRAAHAAGQRFAFAQAAGQWRRVITLWPEGAESAGDPAVRRIDAYLAAIDAFWGMDVAAAAALSGEALRTMTNLAATDAAALFSRAGDVGGIVGDPAAADLLKEALRLYESMPDSSGYVHALDRYESHLRMVGRYEDAAAAAERASEVAVDLGDVRLQRSSLARRAWHAAVIGDRERACAHMRTALRIQPAEPDPEGAVHVAAFHTELLLMRCAAADEVEKAGRPALDLAAIWDLDTFLVAKLRAHVSLALTRAGHVRRAAELVDPATEKSVVRDRWPVHLQRASLDVLRGLLEPASLRLDALSAIDVPWIGQRLEVAEQAAVTDLWSGRPSDAFRRMRGLLRYAVTTDISFHAAGPLALAARAAADLASWDSTTAAGRRELDRELQELLARAVRDPFAAHPTFAAHPAFAATWAAEVARLVGTPSLEPWVTASQEWDKLGRPHAAAYCRWRAAREAQVTGQGSSASRLLRRAARDARGHVPLGTAIELTAAGTGNHHAAVAGQLHDADCEDMP